MIPQANKSFINSRDKCNPYYNNEYLPLIVAPMSSVIDENNYDIFIKNKVQICLPRTIETIFWEDDIFISLSLQEFIDEFLERVESFIGKRYVCIDTANGNMNILHEAIIAAKEKHGDNLIIMTGNVATVSAFVTLALTGVDYIRIGIGGSNNACTTTKNVGVGQVDLEDLIRQCYNAKKSTKDSIESFKGSVENPNSDYYKKRPEVLKKHKEYYYNAVNLKKVKIVADGISTYIKQCQEKYGFNDNGYAAINKLLYYGADLVMVGALFAQCLESAAEKYIKANDKFHKITQEEATNEYPSADIYSMYYGMSTTHAQRQYKTSEPRPSEGSIKYLPIKYRLSEWLYGAFNQDEYPYLMGYVNSLKSAMSYTNVENVENFKYR